MTRATKHDNAKNACESTNVAFFKFLNLQSFYHLHNDLQIILLHETGFKIPFSIPSLLLIV
jgi:hypothetical protein